MGAVKNEALDAVEKIHDIVAACSETGFPDLNFVRDIDRHLDRLKRLLNSNSCEEYLEHHFKEIIDASKSPSYEVDVKAIIDRIYQEGFEDGANQDRVWDHIKTVFKGLRFKISDETPMGVQGTEAISFLDEETGEL